MKQLILFILMLQSAACSNHAETQFYMLNAEVSGHAEIIPETIDKQLVIGLGPVHLPEYLNRPQIVIERGENQFQLNEDHRWAERLDQNISRSLAQFFTANLGLEQVVRFPWGSKQHIDYQVAIDILALHQGADGQSQFRAQWQILHPPAVPLSKQFVCHIPSANTPEAIVKAQSLCLNRLGLEIADGLRQLSAEK